ncbi:MAG: FAD-binding oxidoreductase, partial [Phaeodactylibacter sp.]|nr:FAD-binding oxidoreductase [Phaeodactylibacter sp.]
GGGLFGVYAALHFSRSGQRVCLIEKEAALFRKASIVNQARLHTGYHYPRSVATAIMSNDHRERFSREHAAFVNRSFEKYYAIDRFGSFTDPAQFERFCAFVKIPCEQVPAHPLFNYDRLLALYRTEEHSFDPLLIARYYTEQIREAENCTVLLQHRVCKAETAGTD